MSSDFDPLSDPDAPAEMVGAEIGPSSGAESNGTWILLGIVSAVAALAISAWNSFPLQPTQGRQVLFVAVIAVIALIVLRLVFRSAWRVFRSRPVLLVPIGVVAGVSQLAALLPRLPVLGAMFLPEWTASLMGVTIELSLGILLTIAIWTAYAAWQTELLWRSTCGDTGLSLSPWRPVREGFWRALLALGLGNGVLLVAIVPVIALGVVAFPVAVLGMGALGIGWNVCTAALLPVTLFSPEPLSQSVRSGFQLSWRLKSRWWFQLLAQLLLLGLVVIVTAHFASSTASGSRTSQNTKWSVNAFWAGGYEHNCRWHAKYAEALESGPVPLLSQILAWICLTVAVAMKLTVIRNIDAHCVLGDGLTKSSPSESGGWP